jgi:hypothetical protein
MKQNERVVYFYDLLVKAKAVHAQIPSLNEIYNMWNSEYVNGGCILEREKGTVTYRIGEMKLEANDTLVLLIRKCDQNAPDAAYSDVKTGGFRIAEKTPSEGGDTALHLIISLKVQSKRPDTYLCLMEGMNGISHRHIQPLLNNIVRKVCKDDKATFQYDDPAGVKDKEGKIRRTSFVPTVELKGHMSESFAKDLESGSVNGIELVKSLKKISVGGNAYLQEAENSLRIAVDKKIPSQGRLQSILDAITQKNKSYSTGRIRFTDKDGQGHTVNIDLDTGAVEQQLYIKSYREENIRPVMAYSSETIVGHFAKRLIAKLILERS